MGLVQVLLSVPMYGVNGTMRELFLLPLIVGALIVAGGSFTLASERFPSRKLLQGCACSNVVGLLGTLLAFCLYCYKLSFLPLDEPCQPVEKHLEDDYSPYVPFMCPTKFLMTFIWCLTLLLILYDTVAVVLHCILSVYALKGLKAE
ncbi:uncharacterized protein LOC142996840 isoform X2 [Genypterus blacodes]